MTFPAVPSRVRAPAQSALALALFASCVASPAHADGAVDTIASQVLVTASRTPQAAQDVIADNVVLSAEDISRSGAANLIDLLQQQRAIEVSRNGRPGANSAVYIRGGDAKQNVVLVDGVRVGSSTTGQANWTTLPLTNIERIEIVYGPLATMYGADAIGGVVQIFTRSGAGPAHVFAAAGAGSRGARMAEVAVAGATDTVSYAFSLAREQDTGFSATRPGLSSYNADKDGYDKDSASGRIGVRIADGHEAGMLYLHSHLNAQYDSGASNFDTRTVQNLDNIAVYSRHQLNRDWQLRLQASEAADESTNSTSTAATGTSRIATRQNFYTLQSDLAFGADLLQLIAERRIEEVVSSSSSSLTRSRATNSLAAAYSLKRGAHLATLSARNDDSQYGSKTTGGLGYGYRIGPTLRASASAGTSFRAPTFNELYFAGFGVESNRPERGRNVEGGLHYRSGAASASMVYYRNKLTDLLVNLGKCPVEAATHPSGCAYNVNRATLTGVSAEAATRLGNVELNASLDWQDPRDDTTGKMLVRRAHRHGRVGATWLAGPFTAGASVVFSSRRFDDSANRNVMAGYGLLNLHASYAFAPDWSMLVRWNNATDKQYELARNYATAGSTVYAGLRYGLR
jgi:vitamin B12 transporter